MNSPFHALKKVLIVVGVVLVLSIFGIAFFVVKTFGPSEHRTEVFSFVECVDAGYPTFESHPRQCRTPDGRTYAEETVEEIAYHNASADNIVVELPFPGAVTGKTFLVTGRARGNWFFEASFPVRLIGGHGEFFGKEIAAGIAQAEGDWMTTEFVPFKAELAVPETFIGPATLVLEKDNPSGLAEFDSSMSFPITIEY